MAEVQKKNNGCHKILADTNHPMRLNGEENMLEGKNNLRFDYSTI